MPDSVYITDIASYEGQPVTLSGWLYNSRSSKKLVFLLLRDGTQTAEPIQCVVGKRDVDEETWEKAKSLKQEDAVRITGEVRKDERSPLGYELGVTGIEVVAPTTEAYPISPKEHGTGFLMDHRHLWLRSKRQHVILRVRATLIKAIRDYFDSHDFTLVDAPIFTPNAVEGTTTLFECDYFNDRKAYLTQSGQLYMEAAAMALGKVYCFGPTFRAEKSKTRRHLTEFWMVEPEVAFMDLDGDMDLAEDFLVEIVGRTLEAHRTELAGVLERDVAALERVQKPFPRITYTEGIERVQAQGLDAQWGKDFGGEEETVLAEQFDRPVMVHRYPAAVKAFYMKPDPDDERLALGVDVLAPEGYGEIIGGGQREESLEVLERKIAEHGLPKEVFEWYLDLRRYGSVPHSGFGLGVERTVRWICGLPHVRETIPFPRLMDRLNP